MNDAMYRGVDSTEPEDRTGLYTLKNLLTVSLVAIPGQVSIPLQQSIIDHCEEMRYRFAVLDGPPPPDDTVVDVQNLRQSYDSEYCRVLSPVAHDAGSVPHEPGDDSAVSDPAVRTRPRHLCPRRQRSRRAQGAGERGRPRDHGLHALLHQGRAGDPQSLSRSTSTCMRDFRPTNRGLRVWGARCSTSDPAKKYVNVRRLLIFIEDSIDRGLQWVVFEPNAEQLWARVRRSVTNFLTTVWRNGALEGHDAGAGVLREMRPHDDDARRHRQRPADRAHRHRAGEARRVRHRPHRAVDGRRRQLSKRGDDHGHRQTHRPFPRLQLPARNRRASRRGVQRGQRADGRRRLGRLPRRHRSDSTTCASCRRCARS